MYGAPLDPMYQAVAAPLRAHPLLAGKPAAEVDALVDLVAEAASDEAHRLVDESRTEAWW